MFADYHVHSAYSDDCAVPMEDMVRRAVELGMDEICFTEHVDYDIGIPTCRYEAYTAGLETARQRFQGQITIRMGIEFSPQRFNVDRYEADFARHPFDFVILSCHQVDRKGFWRYEVQQDRTQDEYQRIYYEAVYEQTRNYKNYSVLGHLDMIKRYDPNPPYPDEKILPLVEKILRQVIADGKGIEVNTSSFRYQLPDLTPSRRILELYRELGGEVLTLGSDSHEPSCLGDHFPEVRETLKSIGFRQFCTFEGMQPRFHPL